MSCSRAQGWDSACAYLGGSWSLRTLPGTGWRQEGGAGGRGVRSAQKRLPWHPQQQQPRLGKPSLFQWLIFNDDFLQD